MVGYLPFICRAASNRLVTPAVKLTRFFKKMKRLLRRTGLFLARVTAITVALDLVVSAGIFPV